MSLLFLPLCPSTNRRMQPVRMGNICREILTKEAREYIATQSWVVKSWCSHNRFKRIESYTPVWVWFILKTTVSDSHNFLKILADTLEEGGVTTNDKYLLFRIGGVFHDFKNPEIIIKL